MHDIWPWAVPLLACSLGCGESVEVGSYPAQRIGSDADLSDLALAMNGTWKASDDSAELALTHRTQDNPRAGSYDFRCGANDCVPLLELFEWTETAGVDDPRRGRFQLLTPLAGVEWTKAECVLIPSEVDPLALRVEVWLRPGSELRLVTPFDGSFVDFVPADE